jgi:hypothetical protein
MMAGKQFQIREVLSITTQHLLRDFEETPGEYPVECFYKVCDFMRGQAHQTLQLPDASALCRDEIHRQHPWLREVTADVLGRLDELAKATTTDEEYRALLVPLRSELDARYPDPVTLEPIPLDDRGSVPSAETIWRSKHPNTPVTRIRR